MSRGGCWCERVTRRELRGCGDGKEVRVVKVPTPDQLREISASYNLNLSDADVASLLGLAAGAMDSYRRLDDLVEPVPEVKYLRS